MTFLRSIILGAMVVTAMTFAAAAQSSPGSFRVAEAGSCQGWFDTCLSRCSTQKELKCDRAFCSGKLATCHSSGCWKEGSHFANAVHCGLAK
jgi:hypothetical protein